MNIKAINIGCGLDIKEGWVNLDFDKSVSPDILFDLNEIYSGKKLPFESNSFDYVYCVDVLEHFPDPLPLLREFYRICKIGGAIEIKVPYGEMVFINLDHKRMFFLNSFELNNFDYDNTTKKNKVKLVYKRLYTQPTKSLIKKIVYGLFLSIINPPIGKKSSLYDQTFLRFIFPNTNIHVKYKKLS